MRNFIQAGEILTLVAPYAVTSGQGLQVGRVFGVATSDAASGANVEANRTGVFELTALNTDAAAVGALAYWDNTNRRITATASTNLLLGAFVVAKTNGQTVATVLLDGAVR